MKKFLQNRDSKKLRGIVAICGLLLFGFTTGYGQDIALALETGGVPSSPLVAGAPSQAIIGLSLDVTTSAATLEQLQVDLSNSPAGILSGITIYSSTDDALFDKDVDADLGFTPTGTTTLLFDFLPGGIPLAVGTHYYFIVANIEATVDDNTSQIEPSIDNADVIVTAGTVTGGTITGTDFAFEANTVMTIATNGVAASPLIAGAVDQAILGFSLNPTAAETFEQVIFDLTNNPTSVLTNFRVYQSTDDDTFVEASDTDITSSVSGQTTTTVTIDVTDQVLTTGAENYFFIVADIDGSVTTATTQIQPSFDNADVQLLNLNIQGGTITGTDYAFRANTIMTNVTGGIAGSPLLAGSTSQAILGFSLNPATATTFEQVDVNLTVVPTGIFSDYKIYSSANNSFAIGDDTDITTGVTGTATTTLTFDFIDIVLNVGAENYYFIVMDIDGTVTSATSNQQPTIGNADVTLSGGTKEGGPITGTDYAFDAAVSLTEATGGLGTDPLIAGSTVAVLGFSLNPTAATTFDDLLVNFSNDPTGILSGFALYSSDDATFGGDTDLSFTVTGTNPITIQVDPDINLNVGSENYYFVVADVANDVDLNTTQIQASIDNADVIATGGTVSGGTIQGIDYSFEANTVMTIATGGVAGSPLVAGDTDQAILGFSLNPTTAETFEQVIFNLTNNPTSVLTNFRVYQSTDDDTFVEASDTDITSSVSGETTTTVTIDVNDQVLTTGSENYFFIVANVDGSVDTGTSNIQPSIDNADVSLTNLNIQGGTITGTDYSFTSTTAFAEATNGVAGDPLIASTADQAVVGFSLNPSSATDFDDLTVNLTSDPTSVLNSFRIYQSTDDDTFVEASDTDITTSVSGTTTLDFTFTSVVLNVGVPNYFFIVADVDASVDSGTPNIQASIGLSDVVLSTGVKTGSTVSGIDYTFGCEAPTSQATSLSFTNVTSGTFDVGFTSGNGDATLVVIYADGVTPVAPTNGMGYGAGVADITLTPPETGTDNFIIFNQATGTSELQTPFTVSGLSGTTTYHVAVYEYFTADNCYNQTALTGSQATNASGASATITNGSGAEFIPSTAVVLTNPGAIAFTFTINDIDSDGDRIEIESIDFMQGSGNDLVAADWTQVIAKAELSETGDVNAGQHDAAVINATSIFIDKITNHGDPATTLGRIGSGSAKTYELKIWLKDDISFDIDGVFLGFSIHEDNVVYHGSHSILADDETADSNDILVNGPTNNDQIQVIATKFVVTLEPDPTTRFAGETFSTQMEVEARDVSDYVDLDYAGPYTVTSTPSLTLINAPTNAITDISNGVITLASDFAFGEPTNPTATITITDDGSAFFANSTALIINGANDSDITIGSFTEDPAIDFLDPNNQGSVSDLSVEVLRLVIRDGGIRVDQGLDGDEPPTDGDLDNLSTVLTNLDLSITGGNGILDEIGIYDGSTQLRTATISAATNYLFDFTAPDVLTNTTAPDDGSKILSVRATFHTSPITDGSTFDIAVNAATADPSFSIFKFSDAQNFAGDPAQATDGVDVIATKFEFTTEPSPYIQEGIGLTSQIPAKAVPVLEALDASDNFDIDYGETVDITNGDAITMSVNTIDASSGILTFPTNFTYTSALLVPLDGTLTLTENAVTGTSIPVIVDGVDPTYVLSGTENGPTITNGFVKNGDVVTITATFTENDIIDDGIDGSIKVAPTISIAGIGLSTPISNVTMMESSNTVWTYDWTVPADPDVTVNVTIAATDRAGNVAVPDVSPGVISYVIDNIDPTLVLSDNKTGDQDDKFVRDQQTTETIDITATFTDVNTLLSDPMLSIGGLVGPIAMDPTGNPLIWTYNWAVSHVTDPEVADITVTVDDMAGNPVATPYSGRTTYTIDNTSPTSTLDPFFDLHNVPLVASFTMNFDEDVIGNGDDAFNVRLYQVALPSDIQVGQLKIDDELGTSTSAPVTSVEFTLAELGVAGGTLLENTEYYIEVDPGAIIDKAENPHAGTDASTWFFTTFGAPEPDDFAPLTKACIGQTGFQITGKYMTGVTTIKIGGSTGVPVPQDDFTVTDDLITLQIPDLGQNGAASAVIYLEKTAGAVASPPNLPDIPDNAVTKTDETNSILLGPSYAEIHSIQNFWTETDIQGLCDEGPSTNFTEVKFQVEIIGGSDSYTLVFKDNTVDLPNGTMYTINDYASMDEIIIPFSDLSDLALDPTDNIFTIVSVKDNNLNCYLPGSEDPFGTPAGVDITDPDYDDQRVGDFTVKRFERSVVDPGTNFDVCVIVGDVVDLAGSITGSVTTGTWSTPEGTGTFNFNAATAAQYNITLSDALLGGLTFKLTSDVPTGFNHCLEKEEQITVTFTSTATSNPGLDATICLSHPFYQLSGQVGGSATTGIWTTLSTSTIPGGFSPSPHAATSTDLNATYYLSTDEIADFNGGSITSIDLQLETTDASCGNQVSSIITLFISNNPTITAVLPIPDEIPPGDGSVISICPGETATVFEVAGPVSTSYDWDLSGAPNATITAGAGTKKVFINWDLTTGPSPISVTYLGEGPNCPSNTIDFDVDVRDLPAVSIVTPVPAIRTFSKDEANILLEGSDLPPSGFAVPTRSSQFTGPGVILGGGGQYFFDPDVAGVTPEVEGVPVPHIITYTYTDDYGCTNNTDPIDGEFIVYDASASVLIAGTNDVLASEYCEDYGQITIKVADVLPEADGFEFHEFVEQHWLKNVDATTAIFDTKVAGDSASGGDILIEFTQINGSSTVIPFGSQVTTIHLLPDLAPDIDDFPEEVCSNEASFTLTRNQAINPLSSFVYFIVGGDTDGLIEVDPTGPVYTFNPGKEPFEADDFTGHTKTIGYTYTNNNGCISSTSFDITIFQWPDKPESQTEFGCEGTENYVLTVTNTVPGATIRWYDNSAASGTPLSQSTSKTFSTTVTSLGTTNFYVTQEINGCESDPTTVPVIITNVLTEDVSFTIGDACSGAGTQFNGSYTPAIPAEALPIATWSWDFGDETTGTGQNPVHTYTEPGNYIVSLQVTNTGGCINVIPFAKTITVGSKPAVALDFFNICAEQSSSFVNLTVDNENAISKSALWTFMEWDGTVLQEIAVNDASKVKDTVLYTFQESGRKKVQLTITTVTGCFDSEILELFILPSITVTDADPYDSDDFELTADKWISWGPDQGTAASDWEYATPAGDLTPYDGSAWVTNADSPYSANATSLAYSPCFDLSGLAMPMVSFQSTVDALGGSDGAVFQYSTDGRFDNWETIGSVQSGINWYNESGVVNIPGSLESNQFAYGWSSEDKTWKLTRHTLEDDIGDNNTRVIFRFAFTSGLNDQTEGLDGFAFDDFEILSRQRVVVLEHFEGTGDASARMIEDVKDDFSDDEDELVKIQYVTGLDEQDDLATAEINARVDFYGITVAPLAIFDGAEDFPDINNGGEDEFTEQSLTDPEAKVTITGLSADGGTLSVTAKVSAVIDITSPFLVFTTVIERDSDGKQNVVRKMLPDAAGERFEKLLTSDGSITVSNSWKVDNLTEDALDLAVVVHVQYVDKESEDDVGPAILQSTVMDLDDDLMLTGLDELADGTKYLLYPNPASDQVSLKLMSPVTQDSEVRLFDQFGKMVHKQILQAGGSLTEIDLDPFASGVYIIQLESKTEILMRNKIIVSH